MNSKEIGNIAGIVGRHTSGDRDSYERGAKGVDGWVSVPVGLDAPQLVTRVGCRTVLAVVHTTVSCHRILDVLELVETDPRVQVIFTVVPGALDYGVAQQVQALGALVMPWEQAKRQQFDLALAAAHSGTHELHAPLVVMAHGAGHGKPIPMSHRGGPPTGQRPVYGLDAQRLTRDGRVLASAILLAHHGERKILRHQCPAALSVASIVGDPCYDRLIASLPARQTYRAALGIHDEEKLVVVASTWGRHGLFGNVPDLLPRLLDQVPTTGLRVGALVHPAVWSAHGPRQIRAWTRECRDAGLILLEPQQDWRAVIAAADYLIGDHGSVTVYGAAIGLPVLQMAATNQAVANPGTAQHAIITRAPRLNIDRPLEPQLRAAPTMDIRMVTAAVTAYPRHAGMRIRRILYDLLRLPTAGTHRQTAAVPAPGAILEASRR